MTLLNPYPSIQLERTVWVGSPRSQFSKQVHITHLSIKLEKSILTHKTYRPVQVILVNGSEIADSHEQKQMEVIWQSQTLAY